jgi:hypothetical protein
VHVRQEGETPEDKGVDIHGQTLQLLKFPDGSVLKVTGETAEVQLDKLTIFGPEVNIDQRENKAWVNGPGAMRMPSNASFNGDPLSKPTELTVYWTRDMFFNGKYALYHGNIQAEQENVDKKTQDGSAKTVHEISRLTCQTMQVLLDRFVSLKEGADKSAPPAKVENLVCDKSVRIEDTTREEGRLVRYQRIESAELKFENEEGILLAPGPGVLRILQYGAKDDSGPTPAAQPAAGAKRQGQPPEEELKLTRVNYLGRMFANNTNRTAIFYDNVEVVHVPTNNPDLPINLNQLPEGAMYLRCDQLKVYNSRDSRDPNAKVNQLMEAYGHSQVQSREFYGRADVIKFDESKSLVVFEASDGNFATLVRQKARGGEQEELKGKKIWYWRNTNDFKIEGGTGARVIQ